MNVFRSGLRFRIGILLATFCAVSPCAAESALTINIGGFENDEGLARIVLFDSPASYQGSVPPFQIVSVPIRQSRATWTNSNIPAGVYAAIVHHDLDANDELDRPYFGLPLEPYGYSNDAFKTFGIPSFDIVKFSVNESTSNQNINIQYNPIAAPFVLLQPFRNLVALTLVLVLPLVILGSARRWLPPWASDRRLLGRVGLTLLLFMTSSAHFTSTSQMMLMLPDWVPAREMLIYATGVLEISLAIGLWMPGLVQKTGWAIALMLVIFLPANIYASFDSLPFGGNQIGPAYLFVRVPFQIFLVLWTLWSTGLIQKTPVQPPASSQSGNA
jgi:uncharacterized protein (DUF2141 family)/uncharacterized membrane protein